MIYEILISTVVLIAILFVIYLFYPPTNKGIPKEPAKKSYPKEKVQSVPYYSEGEVIVEDELYGMKLVWDAYEDRVENFIKFLESSKRLENLK